MEANSTARVAELQPNTIKGRLSVGERFAYGLGDFGSNMVWQMVTTFLLFYYTDVAGLAAAAIGILFLINRVWDILWGLFIGWRADQTRSRFGAYRPYLLYGSVPFAVMLVVAFSLPSLRSDVALGYAFVSLFLLETTYNIVNVPYAAMITVITENEQEHANLASARFLGTIVATLLVSGATPGILATFSNQHQGFQAVTSIYAIIAFVSFLLCFRFTRERAPIQRQQRLRLIEVVRVLRANGPLFITVMAIVLLFTGFTIRNSAALYYFKYNLGHEEQAGLFFVVFSLLGIAGAFIAPSLSRRLEKRNTTILFLAIFALGGLIWYVFGDSLLLALVGAAFGGMGMVGTAVMIIAMIPDTIDYAEWRSGLRAPGVAMAINVSSTKLATAIGTALVGVGLAVVHYVPNGTQSGATLTGIRNLMSLYPTIGAVIAIVVMFFYPLTHTKSTQIVADLEMRRNSADKRDTEGE
jgi:GPH family glycoside/pentoside/hexuronide:cation symporter